MGSTALPESLLFPAVKWDPPLFLSITFRGKVETTALPTVLPFTSSGKVGTAASPLLYILSGGKVGSTASSDLITVRQGRLRA